MLTALEAQLANRPAVSPADRMYTPAILPPGRPEPPRRPVAARESTLYPLLTRLPRNGLVETSWQESNAGPPRRYYHLTRDGELALASFQKQWRVFGDAVNEQREPGMTSRESAGEADKLVRRYLAQLDAALQGIDASRREEILAEVHEHIEEGRTGLDPDDAAGVRTLLSRVGDPAAIAAEAGAPPPDSRRWDAWAPWLIIFGPVASGLGWIAGMLILWTSPTWSQRDKLIATFVPPAGLAALFFGLVTTLRAAAGCPGHVPAPHAPAGCTTSKLTLPLAVAILLAVAGLAAHVLPPIHLMRTRRQQRSTFA